MHHRESHLRVFLQLGKTLGLGLSRQFPRNSPKWEAKLSGVGRCTRRVGIPPTLAREGTTTLNLPLWPPKADGRRWNDQGDNEEKIRILSSSLVSKVHAEIALHSVRLNIDETSASERPMRYTKKIRMSRGSYAYT